ncbi:MAG: PH domain-containing protein [Patescibacteria group bacterium]|jgi:quinol-cytochrome oxidoreductase complex cytochrome b subunit
MQEEEKKESEFTFQGQRPEEKVVDVINSHPYVIYPTGFRVVLILAVVAAVFILFPQVVLWAYISAGVIGALSIVYFWSAYYGFKESVLIITDERIFYVSQKGFFRRKIFEADLANILDVSSETKGFFKTVLKYGDLIVRTAGAKEEGDIIVQDIPDPYYAQQKIASVRPKTVARPASV